VYGKRMESIWMVVDRRLTGGALFRGASVGAPPHA
jgi:hypothetical protein